MTQFWKFFKYISLITFTLLILSITGLLLYYEIAYDKSPTLTEIKAFKVIPHDDSLLKPIILLPVPRSVKWTDERYQLPNQLTYNIPPEDSALVLGILNKYLIYSDLQDYGFSIDFKKNVELRPQEYLLRIKTSNIEIHYHQPQGLFYALTTFKQILLQSPERVLPGVEIIDHPDLKVRGALLDISRNKIPKLETLYAIVDVLSDLKYNQLQVYIEGFSFAYPSFRSLWQHTETPLSPEEIQKLDQYCKDRFIELVPNQNSLGHMASWLQTEVYQELAECPNGYTLFGMFNRKATLCPTDPRSLELVKSLSDDLLPNFSSSQFNVNLDEPFELGTCKSKQAAKQAGGVARLYLEYTKKLHKYVKGKGKKMMMWGDVAAKHPEIIQEMPKDITLLEWGYESNHPFEAHCYQLQQAKQPFMVCPGTSSWSSFTGRTFNMMTNIENAIQSGIRFGAEGMLLTDWGDFGHLQYLTVSYAGLAYGGALSWNYQGKNQVQLDHYLSKMIFKDQSNLMGNLVLNMGVYNQFEEVPMITGTTTAFVLRFGFMDKVVHQAINQKIQPGMLELLPLSDKVKKFYAHSFKNPQPYHHHAILYLVDSLEQQLEQVNLKHKEAKLILDEYRNALRMVSLCAKIKQYNNYHLQQNQQENLTLLQEIKALCLVVTKEHQRLWLMRNKPGRLDLSLALIQNLQNQTQQQLKKEAKNGLTRWINRSMEKVIHAGTSLFL